MAFHQTNKMMEGGVRVAKASDQVRTDKKWESPKRIGGVLEEDEVDNEGL